MALEIIGSNMLTIDTSHYTVGDPAFDNVQSHVVTLRGKVHQEGRMTVCGSGKVIFANQHNNFTGGLTVSDTATLAVNAGCCPGVGLVSMGANTTLEVAQSGTATLGGALTLAKGATLAFTFTEEESVPMLSGEDVTFSSDTVNVKVSAEDGIKAKDARYLLTSGLDFAGKTVNLLEAPEWVKSVYVSNGDIVLVVKKGTAVILR
ncbi:MAG: hypothetical protein J6U40_04135 [Kiritimatiellae bacterium]|nr:hypothetical protein [Kiritimatiellia bacterium]